MVFKLLFGNEFTNKKTKACEKFQLFSKNSYVDSLQIGRLAKCCYLNKDPLERILSCLCNDHWLGLKRPKKENTSKVLFALVWIFLYRLKRIKDRNWSKQSYLYLFSIILLDLPSAVFPSVQKPGIKFLQKFVFLHSKSQMKAKTDL